MSTTNITSGSDFIGKTLIICSTGSVSTNNWTRILEFYNSNSINYSINSTFQNGSGKHYLQINNANINPSVFTSPPNYDAVINVLYIYTYSFVSTTQWFFYY
jgi:TRAP-type uncharacterized transport system substrate-binding protein